MMLLINPIVLLFNYIDCWSQVSFPLEYTPRKFVIHQDTGNMILIETEHNAYTEQTKNLRRIQMAKVRTKVYSNVSNCLLVLQIFISLKSVGTIVKLKKKCLLLLVISRLWGFYVVSTIVFEVVSICRLNC